jgi:hypothetical protein
MSPLSKVKMSPSEDKKIGEITSDECARSEPIGSNEKVERKESEPGRSGENGGGKCAASEAHIQSVPGKRSARIGIPATRAGK